MRIQTRVNGQWRTGVTEPRRSLSDFLRVDLGLTGTHVGCEHGVCGACTITMDGEAVRSCLLLAVQADGKDLGTIEGLEVDGSLNVLQEAMAESHAFQCGFCTPGFLMTLTAMMEEQPEGASRAVIREYLSGNICRCSGYQTIVDGAELAMRRCREASCADRCGSES